VKSQKLLFILTLMFSQLIYANPYSVGDTLLPMSFQDQNDKAGFINEKTQIILFSRNKAGGDLLKTALDKIPEQYFSQHNIVFISDISQMPGLISKYMAIPSMRKRNYPILLDHDGLSSKNLPDRTDAATLITIELLQIKSITHLSSSDEIKHALKLK